MADSDQAASFRTTHWSLVLAAGQRSTPECERALAILCRIYWPAVYAFVRRRVSNLHDAQDFTQAFFTQLLEKNVLAVVQPARGRFRSFLLTAAQHFLHNEWDKQKAQKRGGGKGPIPLDFQEADSRAAFEPADTMTPERLYERQWALALLDQVMARLRAEHDRASKDRLFDALKGTLAGDAQSSLADVAAQLGISANAAKVAAHRLRKRYRELLRAEVRETVADPAEVDDEIRQLFAALG